MLYVRRCGFRRAVVEAVGTDDFRLVDLSGKPPPQNVSLEVLPRMDYWSDQAHALLELLARGLLARLVHDAEAEEEPRHVPRRQLRFHLRRGAHDEPKRAYLRGCKGIF